MNLLEREHQLAQLNCAWEAVCLGNGRTVLISGEAGIGKSSLLDTFVNTKRSSAAVLTGGCDALAAPRPLGPLFDWAPSLPIVVGHELRNQSKRGAALFSLVFEGLRSLNQPVILILEDVHWADEASLDLVRFLVRRIRNAPILFLMTFRDDSLPEAHPVRLLLGDLNEPSVIRLLLPPLSEDAVNKLASLAVVNSLEVHRISRGNPFFVTELLRNPLSAIPNTIRESIWARFVRLNPPARALAQAVSIIPSKAEWSLLSAMHATLDEALNDCCDSGLLVQDGKLVCFRHELARLVIETSLLPNYRAALHAQCLEALLTLPLVQPHINTNISRLAHHATGSGNAAAICKWVCVAAREATDLRAWQQAAMHYRTLCDNLHAVDDFEKAKLLMFAASAYLQANQLDNSIATGIQAANCFRDMGKWECVCECLRIVARAHWLCGNRGLAEAAIDEGMRLVAPYGATKELAWALAARASLHMTAENDSQAILCASEAIGIARELDVPEILIHALNTLGDAQQSSDAPGWRENIEHSLQLALTHNFADHVGRAYVNLVSTAVYGREYAIAEKYFADGIAYCTENDLDFARDYMSGWHGRALFETGRWTEAETLATTLTDKAQIAPVSRMVAMLTLAGIFVRRGCSEAKELLNQLLADAERTGEHQRIAPVLALQAEAAWLADENEVCAAIATEGYALASKHSSPEMSGCFALWLWRTGRIVDLAAYVPARYSDEISGRWRAASAHWQLIGCPYESAMAQIGGDGVAQRHALVKLFELGAAPLAHKLRQRLISQGERGLPRGPRAPARNHPAGLTAREIEILKMLAAGLTNTDIAARITRSRRTVEHHVESIYAKLVVNNRSDALAWYVAYKQDLEQHDSRFLEN